MKWIPLSNVVYSGTLRGKWSQGIINTTFKRAAYVFKITYSWRKWDIFNKTLLTKQNVNNFTSPHFFKCHKIQIPKMTTQHCHSSGRLICYLIYISHVWANIPGVLAVQLSFFSLDSEAFTLTLLPDTSAVAFVSFEPTRPLSNTGENFPGKQVSLKGGWELSFICSRGAQQTFTEHPRRRRPQELILTCAHTVPGKRVGILWVPSFWVRQSHQLITNSQEQISRSDDMF